jgi:hypothetical protein
MKRKTRLFVCFLDDELQIFSSPLFYFFFFFSSLKSDQKVLPAETRLESLQNPVADPN